MTTMTPTQAQTITQGLIREHGLTGWRVTFDSAKRRAGLCNSGRRVISLSRYLMAQRSYDDTMMTITHEIAHAIVGAGHGHDAVWARQHRALGGNGQRCFAHVDESAPWMGECDHGKQFPRYRAPRGQFRCRCPRPSVIVWRKTADAPRPVVVPAPVVVVMPAPVARPLATAASTSRPAPQDPDAAKRAQWAANKRASRARLAAKRAAS